MAVNNPSNGPTRLDSWKEIAAFLGRDERTVNRWEKELGLPVHRLPGTKGRGYAYTEELSAWLAKPKKTHAALLEFNSAGQPGAHTSGLSIVYGRRATDEIAPRENPAEEKVSSRRTWPYRNSVVLLAVALVVLVAVGPVLFQLTGSHDAKTDVGPSETHVQQLPSGGIAQASTASHDPEAEQFYLKGRYYWNKRTPDDLNKALDYFMQAVVYDPNYAPALRRHGGLLQSVARIYADAPQRGLSPSAGGGEESGRAGRSVFRSPSLAGLCLLFWHVGRYHRRA
jgi:hypothetical protein